MKTLLALALITFSTISFAAFPTVNCTSAGKDSYKLEITTVAQVTAPKLINTYKFVETRTSVSSPAVTPKVYIMWNSSSIVNSERKASLRKAKLESLGFACI